MLLLECLLDLIRFLLGAALFSFMNVVAWRLPRGMDPCRGAATARSAAIRWARPTLCRFSAGCFCAGGAATAARASRCGIFWSRCWAACWRWAAPGAGTALSLTQGLFGMSWAALTALSVCGILLSIALIDAETQLIPDRLNLALAVCGVVGTLLSPAGWLPHLIGAFCVSVPMLLLCLAIDGAFGGGDIKLMAAAGLFLGWQNTLLAMFLGILGGGLYGIWLLAAKRADKRTTLPSARFYVRAS